MGDTTVKDDKIAVMGDSHALVMTAFFDVVGKENQFNFSYLSTNSVTPFDGINDTLIKEEYKQEHNDALLVSRKLFANSKIIFVVKNWHGDNGYFTKVFEKLILKLKPNQNLVLVSDFPAVKINPVRQYNSIIKPKKILLQKVIFPAVPSEITNLINLHQNVYVLNLKNADFFKTAPFYNDTLMYYDENHINSYGAKNYAKFEGGKLADLINKIKSKNNLKQTFK